MIENQFGETISDTYTTHKYKIDILILAVLLIKDYKTNLILIGFRKKVYLSEDLWINKGNIFEEKIKTFNNQYILKKGKLQNTVINKELDMINLIKNPDLQNIYIPFIFLNNSYQNFLLFL